MPLIPPGLRHNCLTFLQALPFISWLPNSGLEKDLYKTLKCVINIPFPSDFHPHVEISPPIPRENSPAQCTVLHLAISLLLFWQNLSRPELSCTMKMAYLFLGILSPILSLQLHHLAEVISTMLVHDPLMVGSGMPFCIIFLPHHLRPEILTVFHWNSTFWTLGLLELFLSLLLTVDLP